MKHITKITINDYRFFHGKETIVIPNDKNVLIYGENGSGKSSLYQALYDFFESSKHGHNFQSKPLSENLFVKQKRQDEDVSRNAEGNVVIEIDNENRITPNVINDEQVSISVSFDGNNDEYIAKNTNPTHQFQDIVNATIANGFLNYKDIIKLYLNENNERTNYFYLFLNLAKDNTNSFTGNKLTDDWEYIQQRLGANRNQIRFQELKDGIINFKKGFNNYLKELETHGHLQDMLDNYESNLKFTYSFYLDFNEKAPSKLQRLSRPELYIEPVFNGVSLYQHDIRFQNFLNEARLSALALSVYLSSILIRPQNSDYKILFLDDVFIGMDMSNRLPLLNILKKHFSEYQIFIATYDRHWFEIAKQQLKDWATYEMYSGIDEITNIQYPIIISDNNSHYEKAKKYANKHDKSSKNLDYPAAANYLRKETEQILKNLLYGNYRLKTNDEEVVFRTQLGELWQSFEKMMKNINFSLTAFQDFETLSKAVFNPLSHDNLDKPIYKTELDKAFSFVKALRDIKKTILVEANTILVLEVDFGGNTRNYEIISKEPIILYAHDTQLKSNAELIEFTSDKYTENGVTTPFLQEKGQLSKLYDKAMHDISNRTIRNASGGINMLEKCKTQEGKTLQILIEQHNA